MLRLKGLAWNTNHLKFHKIHQLFKLRSTSSKTLPTASPPPLPPAFHQEKARKQLHYTKTGIFKSPFNDIVFEPPVSVYSLIFPNDKVEDEWKDKVAFIDDSFDDALVSRSVTYSQVYENAKYLSTGIRTLNLDEGPLLLYSPNTLWLPIIMLAGLRIGCPISPSNPLYQPLELAHQLRDSGSKLIFTSPQGLSVAEESVKQAGLPPESIVVISEQKGPFQATNYKTVQDLILAGKLEKEAAPAKKYSKSDIISGPPAFLCYSSGTTGLSKGVMTSHDNISFNCAQVQSIDPIDDTVLMATLPMYHIYCLQIVLIWGMWRKSRIVVQRKFQLEKFLAAIQNHKVQIVAVVPPIVLKMAKDATVSNFDLSSLREAVCAAAPLSKDLSDAFESRLGIKVKQAYGMTEMSPLSHYTPSTKVVPGSVGVLLPNCMAKIIDLDGNPLGIEQEGELIVKGRMVMQGYLNNPKATSATIDSEGYLHTGDVAVTRDGLYFEVVDRLKELIKFKGFPVIPAELEALLLTHPEVLDAAIIGVKDPECGELPKAFVVVKDGSTVQENEIQDYVATRVANYKKLRGGVEFIDAIPKSAAGKILRRFLRN